LRTMRVGFRVLLDTMRAVQAAALWIAQTTNRMN